MTKEVLNDLLGFLASALKQGVNFTTENIPIWVKEVLQYKIFSNVFALTFFSILLFVTIFVFLKNHSKLTQKIRYNYDYISFYILFTFICGISTIFIISTISNLVMINVAPMYYLMKLLHIM